MNTIPYIIADNKIPYLKGILEPYVRIDYLSPERINAQTVQDADILLIRTRTKCNRELLDRSRCRYIATATIGYDHIDTLYCKEKGISWQNAPVVMHLLSGNTYCHHCWLGAKAPEKTCKTAP